MIARDIEQAGTALRRDRRRLWEASLLAVATALAAAVAGILWPSLAVPLAAGAALESVVAVVSGLARRERIARLALDPAAYILPEVERYGRRLAEPTQRARLAASIRRVMADAHLPGNFFLADRVSAFGHELEALARELVVPAARVEPVCAVACYRLLTRAVESPLYNPRLTPEDLRHALKRIRAGIQPA